MVGYSDSRTACSLSLKHDAVSGADVATLWAITQDPSV